MHVEFFVVGFPKSGTSTIHRAFREARMRSAHWICREGYCGQVIYRDFREGQNPLITLRRYHAISQADICLPDREKHGETLNFWPQLDFEVIEAIEQHNPNVRFILNRRDPAALIRSISKWAALRNRIVRADIPGLPRGKGRTDEELEAWITGHYDACREHFKGTDKLLDFDIADPQAHAMMQEFVGRELPWWGVANTNAERYSSAPPPAA